MVMFRIRLGDWVSSVDVPYEIIRKGIDSIADYITNKLSDRYARRLAGVKFADKEVGDYNSLFSKWYDSHYFVIRALVMKRLLVYGEEKRE